MHYMDELVQADFDASRIPEGHGVTLVKLKQTAGSRMSKRLLNSAKTHLFDRNLIKRNRFGRISLNLGAWSFGVKNPSKSPKSKVPSTVDSLNRSRSFWIPLSLVQTLN